MADALKAELEAVNAKIMALFRKRDAAVLSKMYTEDCSMMPAGSDVVKGRDGVCGIWESMFNAGLAYIELADDEVGPMGSDVVYSRGHYTFFEAEDVAMDHGKYVAIWKRVDGEWLAHIDIFNSNTPPSA